MTREPGGVGCDESADCGGLTVSAGSGARPDVTIPPLPTAIACATAAPAAAAAAAVAACTAAASAVDAGSKRISTPPGTPGTCAGVQMPRLSAFGSSPATAACAAAWMGVEAAPGGQVATIPPGGGPVAASAPIGWPGAAAAAREQ